MPRIQQALRRPSDQGLLNSGSHRAPCSRPVPVIHEASDCTAVVAGQKALADTARQTRDLGVSRRASFVHLSQQMKCARLIQYHAGDAVWPIERSIQRNAAAVGMPDKMN